MLVVGAGLAGLHTARRLAEQGLGVVVVDRRRSLAAGVRTTGIFVRRTLDDFDLPEHLLGPGVRDVLLYPPSRRHPIHLASDRDEYRVADMPGVYAHFHRAAEAAAAAEHARLTAEAVANGTEAPAPAPPAAPRELLRDSAQQAQPVARAPDGRPAVAPGARPGTAVPAEQPGAQRVGEHADLPRVEVHGREFVAHCCTITVHRTFA